MSKSTITRATALSAAIALFPEDAPEREVLSKMLASITKPRATAGKPSKAATENARLAAELLRVMPEGKAVGTRWVQEHVNGILTPQKATAVLAVLVKTEKVSKLKVGKVMTYTKL